MGRTLKFGGLDGCRGDNYSDAGVSSDFLISEETSFAHLHQRVDHSCARVGVTEALEGQVVQEG